MLNTTIVDRRSTTQEVHNHTETNVETSGNIKKTENAHRFISFDTSKQAYKTTFSSKPFYIEKIQREDGYSEGYLSKFQRMMYRDKETKIFISVKQVLITGKIFTLEIEELKREDITPQYNWTENKSIYLNNPTIL